MRFNACVASRNSFALIVPEWSMAPVVEAYQAMRGALVSRRCDFCRRDPAMCAQFELRREQLMSFSRSCPSGTLDRRYGPTEGDLSP